MSHSITTTASYVLNKYSRSYPSSSSGSQVPIDLGWQHFTNPVMTIVLEAVKSPSGQLVSMRLRILWSLHTSLNDLDTGQKDVVFEDLELLSFSSLSTLQPSVAQSDSLPLKAVYRDAVVGIRYLYPRIPPPGFHPVYRRFQITFKNAQDASQFIDAIKSVCPCKANVQSTQLGRQPTLLSTSLTRTATAVAGPVPVRSAVLTECQGITAAPIDSVPSGSSSVLYPASESQALSTNALSSAVTSLSSDDSAFVTCSETSHRSGTRRDDGLSNRRSTRDALPSSLPSSSQLSSSDQSTTMPPPPVPRRVTHTAATQEQSKIVDTENERSQFLASLSKHPSLYELSRTDLETLVSQVIREEGFRHLLESLDSLWSVKGFLGH